VLAYYFLDHSLQKKMVVPDRHAGGQNTTRQVNPTTASSAAASVAASVTTVDNCVAVARVHYGVCRVLMPATIIARRTSTGCVAMAAVSALLLMTMLMMTDTDAYDARSSTLTYEDIPGNQAAWCNSVAST